MEASILAEAQLAELALADDIVEEWRNSDTEAWRSAYAALYHEWMGVPPEAHEFFRQQLETVRDQGVGTVEAITHEIRQQFQLNGGLGSVAVD